MRITRRSTEAAETTVRSAFAAHADELYRFALRLLTEPALAAEAVHEVFLRAWRAHRSHGVPPSSATDPASAAEDYWTVAGGELAEQRAWLLATAATVVLDLAWSRSVPLPEDLQAAADPIGQLLRSWQVEESLRLISADHRRAIVETCYRGRSCAEVAADLGIAEEMLRSRVYYGLRALRLALEEKGWTECVPS